MKEMEDTKESSQRETRVIEGTKFPMPGISEKKLAFVDGSQVTITRTENGKQKIIPVYYKEDTETGQTRYFDEKKPITKPTERIKIEEQVNHGEVVSDDLIKFQERRRRTVIARKAIEARERRKASPR